MQGVLINIIALLFAFNTNTSGDLKVFRENYHNEIRYAYFHYAKIKDQIISQSKKYHTDTSVVSAIVFPELIRYSIYKDFLETNLLEYLYIDYGSKASDFSIGLFQIKPSFVEQLEKEVAAQKEMNRFSFITVFKSSDIKEIRSERLARLKSIEWQIEYVNCFYTLMEFKFGDINFPDIRDKIRFYSTAYNHGFNCSDSEIYVWENKKTFPHGYRSSRVNYSYSDISILFYDLFE